MEISKIRIYPFDTGNQGGKIRAIADVELNGQVQIKGIRIIEGRNGGLFLGMPSIRTKSGQYRDLVVISDKDFASEFREKIIDAYQTAGDRPDSNGGIDEH